jgi:hypothetical protein
LLQKYKTVYQAYKILSDPITRAAYDKISPDVKDETYKISFSQNEIVLGQVQKGVSVSVKLVISLISGDLSTKRLDLAYPDWVTISLTDSNGKLPVIMQVTVDTDQLAPGDLEGVIKFFVDEENFPIPISVTVQDSNNVRVDAVQQPVANTQPVATVVPTPTTTIPANNANSVNLGPWRRKWIPIFIVISVLIVLVQILIPKAKPVDEFSQFCIRPSVVVSGLHLSVTDNGLFMYGKLSAVLLIDGERKEIPEIPSEIVLHKFVKTVVLSTVHVKTGEHAGETQSCDITLFSAN